MSNFPDRKSLDMAPPPHLENIKTATETLGFNMASIPTTGVLLRPSRYSIW